MNKTFMTIPDAAKRVKRERSTIDEWTREPTTDGIPHLQVIWFYGKRYVEVANLLEVYRHKLTASKGGKGKPRNTGHA